MGDNKMNKLLIRLLPKTLVWQTLDQIECENYSWRQILIATEKHGNDLQVVIGCLDPVKDYKSFVIKDSQGYTFNKKDILAISVIDFYEREN